LLGAGCIDPRAFAEMAGRDGHQVYGTLTIDDLMTCGTIQIRE
jgi:hypothetical protein